MFLTVHAASGVLVGSAINNPALAFSAGFILHIILDAIPHGDTAFREGRNENQLLKLLIKFGTADSVIALLYIFFLLYHYPSLHNWNVVAAIIGSIIIDPLSILHLITKMKIFAPFSRLNIAMHFLEEKIRLSFWPKLLGGFLIQVFIFILFNYLILHFFK